MMLLFWLIVLALIVWLATVLLRRGRDGRDTGGAPREDRAESVLRERFARDEIDEETYKRKLDELRRSR